MKTVSKNKRSKSRRIWLPIVVLLLAAAGGLGYFYWIKQSAAPAQAADSTTQTTQVRRGSITISASGSGTLVAGQERALNFSTSGTVASLSVQVGDQVSKGQVLAALDTIDELQSSLNSAQQDLITAQQAVETLRQKGPANLANAQITLASAKKAVTDGQSSVVKPGWVRCDQKTLDVYYFNYVHSKEQLDALGDGGGSRDYYLNTLVPAMNVVAKAKGAYDYCAGYSDYEISASLAELALAQAQLTQAQSTLDSLNQNNGVDPLELATAENKVANAQLTLDQAQAKLDGATLKAPFDGTILSVAGQAGDSAGTSTFITIADLAHPQVEFSVDETDMDKAAVGEQASITFDAVPNQTFTGTVTRIYPALESSGGYQVVKGLIQLDMSQAAQPVTLPKGLNASVELVQAKAEDVLVVPLQAIRDLGDGSYAVFIMNSSGQPRMKVIELGLQDAASAEIKSGLSLGDVVTTGITQTK